MRLKDLREDTVRLDASIMSLNNTKQMIALVFIVIVPSGMGDTKEHT